MLGVTYPVQLKKFEDEGVYYVVTCRDLPELITHGGDIAEALEMAADALAEVLAMYVVEREEVPSPSSPEEGEYLVAPPLVDALKAMLWETMRRGGVTQAALAKRLGCEDREVRRMLNPKNATKAQRLEAALGVLGYNIRTTAIETSEGIQPTELGNSTSRTSRPEPYGLVMVTKDDVRKHKNWTAHQVRVKDMGGRWVSTPEIAIPRDSGSGQFVGWSSGRRRLKA